MCLGITYKYTKLVVYHIFVILIGIPMAILWAVLNGIMVFVLVWLYQPVLRVTVMWIYAVTPLITVPLQACLLYTSPSPRDATLSRMPSSA